MADNKSKRVGASFDELKAAFDMSDESIEKRIGILDKLVLPTPEEPAITVRLLWSKDGAGKPTAITKVVNDKFRNKEGFFMSAELYDRPGPKQLSMSNSLAGSMAAAAKERNISFDDLIGKIGDISSSYFMAAPKAKRSKPCTKCSGKGCQHCAITGSGEGAGIQTGMEPPTVYKFSLRDDLMNSVPKASASSQF